MAKVKSPSDPVKFLYTNHRGIKAIRSVKFGTLKFGASQWHPEFQFFLRGWDTDKNAVRDFALKDCNFTVTELPSEVTDDGTV